MSFLIADKIVDELIFQAEKNEMFGCRQNPRIFEVLASERITQNCKEAMFSGGSHDADAAKVFSPTVEKETAEKVVVVSETPKPSIPKCKKTKNKNKPERVYNEELAMLLEEKEVSQGALMAEIMKKAERILVFDKKIMLYDTTTGCFVICDKDEFAVRLNSLINFDVKLKIKSNEYAEAYKQIMMCQELKFSGQFFENAPFVNCLNGVVDVVNGELLPHDPKYHFKHCIQANYAPGAKCPRYMKYIRHLFDGDEELIRLLQVVQGYICSHYNNAKTAFLVYGEPHTGKSVFHNIIERIIGKQFVSHVDLFDLCKQEYAASLAGKLLNIAPDLKNVPLKDVGFFKSLVSHDDTISTRALYSNPGEIRGETKMIFTSNHLLEFDKSVEENDLQAVFNRLMYLPVQCKPIPENVENKHLSEEIFEERDAIFTWGIEGLRKYVENGERFPKSVLSEQIKEENIARYCPEKVFFDKYIEACGGHCESVTAIKEAYQRFCTQVGTLKKHGIGRYIEKIRGVEKVKKRLQNDQNPVYVYSNIRLKKYC